MATHLVLRAGSRATDPYLAIPYGLAVDAAGNLYIAQVDPNNNLIRKVSANSRINRLARSTTSDR